MNKPLIITSIRITKEQQDYLRTKENASAYLRDLLDRETREENDIQVKQAPEDDILNLLNYKTAITLVMLNELLKAFPNIDAKAWQEKDLGYEANWTKTFKDSSDFYNYFFNK